MSQCIEFGRRSRCGRGDLILPAVVLALLLTWITALAFAPPASGFRLEWGAWVVLWLDLHLAAGWFCHRAARRGA